MVQINPYVSVLLWYCSDKHRDVISQRIFKNKVSLGRFCNCFNESGSQFIVAIELVVVEV